MNVWTQAWSCKRAAAEAFGMGVETNPERIGPPVASLRGKMEGEERKGYGLEFEREWIARAIEQKQSVATECSTRTKEHPWPGPKTKG